MVPRKIFYTPEMQEAFLSSLGRGRRAGYVNPGLSSKAGLKQAGRKESERLMSLDEAGRNRATRKKRHEQDLKHNKRKLKQYKNQIEDQKKSFLISSAINAGQLGVGYAGSKKISEEATRVKEHKKNMLRMKLGYLKKNSPQQYEWLLKQPYIVEQMKINKINIGEL